MSTDVLTPPKATIETFVYPYLRIFEPPTYDKSNGQRIVSYAHTLEELYISSKRGYVYIPQEKLVFAPMRSEGNSPAGSMMEFLWNDGQTHKDRMVILWRLYLPPAPYPIEVVHNNGKAIDVSSIDDLDFGNYRLMLEQLHLLNRL